MNEKEFQLHATQTIQIARFLSVAAVIGFPFAAFSGLAPLLYLFSGVVVGVLWLSVLLIGWRRRSEWLSGLGFLVVLFGHKCAQSMLASEPYPFFFQWLIVTVLTAFGVLALRRSAILHLCQLQHAGNA